MATPAAARLTPREGRRFGFTVGGRFLALATILLWRDRATGAMVCAALAAPLLLAALLLPARLGPIQRAWMGLALAISRVTTPVLMAVIYFLLVTPIGALRRAMGRNAIARDRQAASYWIERARPGRGDLRRQF